MNQKGKAEVLKVLKAVKYGLVILTLAVVIYVTFIQSPAGVVSAVETSGSEFAISTSPPSGFINAPNMAPGDPVSAPLSVSNEGDLDFSYDITAVKESGSELFYNVLDLEIKDSAQNILYSGKLKDLNHLVLGVLGAGGTETFNFTVRLPAESGNEYQRLGAGVTFVLDAMEHPPYIEGGGVVWDPPLERPDVHVRRGVIMPIRFHLINNGTYDIAKRGIDLVITGVNDAGRPVKYVFGTADGALEWEEHGLHKPHYVLMFDAEKYPVKPGAYYTATVKYGDQVLEPATMFKSGH